MTGNSTFLQPLRDICGQTSLDQAERGNPVVSILNSGEIMLSGGCAFNTRIAWQKIATDNVVSKIKTLRTKARHIVQKLFGDSPFPEAAR